MIQPATIHQEVKGKRAWRIALGLCRPSKMRDNTHQLTGTNKNGDRIYFLGTLKEMERKKDYYRQHSGNNLVIAERMLVDERCGLTAKEMW